MSSSALRSGAEPLAGATLSGQRYLFLGPADDPIAGLSAVIFLVDGKALGTETSAPYDARGTRRDGSANALDTRRLRNGTHQFTAITILNGGARITYRAEFRVAN